MIERQEKEQIPNIILVPKVSPKQKNLRSLLANARTTEYQKYIVNKKISTNIPQTSHHLNGRNFIPEKLHAK